MPARTDSPSGISVLMTECANRSSRSSPLEEEVAGLFDQLRNPLLRYVLSLGLAPHDGDEVIQEVFLSLFQHLRRDKPRQNLRGWLYRVAHNLALKQRYTQVPCLAAGANESTAITQDPYPNPEEEFAAKQRQQRLFAVFRALSEQDRCCLHLRAEGLRYREIAEALGISLGAVSLSLVRSLERLSRVDRG